MQQTSLEDRAFPRFTVQIPVRLSLSVSEGGQTIEASGLDVSMNGMSCTVDCHIPIDENMRITIMQPDASDDSTHIIVQCDGVVVRIDPAQKQAGCREYQLALCFRHLSHEQQDLIQTLIESHADILNVPSFREQQSTLNTKH